MTNKKNHELCAICKVFTFLNGNYMFIKLLFLDI